MMTVRWMMMMLAGCAWVALGAASAQQRPAADPAAFFKAIEGTWIYVARVTAGGSEQRSPGIVTFTLTGPTAATFTAASRSSGRSAEHQGFDYSSEWGKLWWDAQRGRIARQEGKDAPIDYLDFFDLGYEGVETLKEGIPSRGIPGPVTMKGRIEAVRRDGTIRWTGEGRNAKGEVVFRGESVFTRVRE